jgi:predicted aspartyl protease
MVQVRQGKLNFTTRSDIPDGASVLKGIFSLNDIPIEILFDSGATHSFISGSLVENLGLSGSHVNGAFTIVTPSGKISSHTVAFRVPLKLGSKNVQSNLIVIGLEVMDVILGMDWMTRHKVFLDISVEL